MKPTPKPFFNRGDTIEVYVKSESEVEMFKNEQLFYTSEIPKELLSEKKLFLAVGGYGCGDIFEICN